MAMIVSITLTVLFLILKKDSVTKGYVGWSILFVMYLNILLVDVVGFTSVSQLSQLSQRIGTIVNPSIIWIPFSQGFDISSALNILVFIPFGVALVVMWRVFQSAMPTFFVGLSFSLLIEIGQIFTMYRQTDVNDLLMNTLGVMIGWVIGKYILKWRIQRNDGKNVDWIVYLLISVCCAFVF